MENRWLISTDKGFIFSNKIDSVNIIQRIIKNYYEEDDYSNLKYSRDERFYFVHFYLGNIEYIMDKSFSRYKYAVEFVEKIGISISNAELSYSTIISILDYMVYDYEEFDYEYEEGSNQITFKKGESRIHENMNYINTIKSIFASVKYCISTMDFN